MGAAIFDDAVAAGPPLTGGNPRLNEWLDAAAEIARAVNQDLSADDLFSLLAGTVVRLTGYDFCSVLLPDSDGEQLLIRGSYGLTKSYTTQVNSERAPLISPGVLAEGPSSRAFRSQRPVVLVDICADATCREWAAAAVKQGYRAILALPLIGSEGALGVLSCYVAQACQFSADEVVWMETFANQAAVAIEATQRRERDRAEIEWLTRRVEALQEDNRIDRRGEMVYRNLMRQLLAGESIDHLTEILAYELRSDVLIEDADGHPLGATICDLGSPSPPTADLGRDPQALALLQEAANEYRAVALPTGDGRPMCLVAPVVLGEELAGRVWAFNPQQPFTALHRRILERGAGVVALAVSRLRTAQQVEWRLSREFLDDLLSAEAHNDTLATLARARQLGVDLNVPHTLVVVRADADDGIENSISRLSAQAARMHRSLVTQVQRLVDAACADALVAARGTDVIILWPQSAQLAAADGAEQLRRHYRSHNKGTLSIGLGHECQEVAEYADAYRLAAGALDLTARAGSRDRVVALGDLGIYRVLLQVKRPDELIDFMNCMLQPLHDYDQRRDTALVQTLRAFLRCGCNATTTAETLIVHPNTISYRLRRIEELLHIECHDPHALLQLQFAFVIQDVLGASTRSGSP